MQGPFEPHQDPKTDTSQITFEHPSFEPRPVLAHLGPSRNPDELSPGALFQWSLVRILLMLCLLWGIKVYEQVNQVSFSEWSLLPRTVHGLIGILTMPLLHQSVDHLYHNSTGLFLLGLGLFFLYPKVAWRVWLISALGGSALVWCFARDSYHLGASGVVYSLSAFLFFSGLLRGDRMSRGGALVVAILYGATIWGVLPLQEGVSWEGHLFGALVGAALAVIFKNVDLPPKEEIVDDEPNPVDTTEYAYWQVTHDDEHGAGQDEGSK